jgi:hypothetical protein
MTTTDERIYRRLAQPRTAKEVQRELNNRDPTYSLTAVTASLARLSAEGRVTYQDLPHPNLPGVKERFWRIAGNGLA